MRRAAAHAFAHVSKRSLQGLWRWHAGRSHFFSSFSLILCRACVRIRLHAHAHPLRGALHAHAPPSPRVGAQVPEHVAERRYIEKNWRRMDEKEKTKMGFTKVRTRVLLEVQRFCACELLRGGWVSGKEGG